MRLDKEILWAWKSSLQFKILLLPVFSIGTRAERKKQNNYSSQLLETPHCRNSSKQPMKEWTLAHRSSWRMSAEVLRKTQHSGLERLRSGWGHAAWRARSTIQVRLQSSGVSPLKHELLSVTTGYTPKSTWIQATPVWIHGMTGNGWGGLLSNAIWCRGRRMKIASIILQTYFVLGQRNLTVLDQVS